MMAVGARLPEAPEVEQKPSKRAEKTPRNMDALEEWIASRWRVEQLAWNTAALTERRNEAIAGAVYTVPARSYRLLGGRQRRLTALPV